MEKEIEKKEEVRILGRQVGRELTREEMELVAGGSGTDSHAGTCTNEADCD